MYGVVFVWLYSIPSFWQTQFSAGNLYVDKFPTRYVYCRRIIDNAGGKFSKTTWSREKCCMSFTTRCVLFAGTELLSYSNPSLPKRFEAANDEKKQPTDVIVSKLRSSQSASATRSLWRHFSVQVNVYHRLIKVKWASKKCRQFVSSLVQWRKFKKKILAICKCPPWGEQWGSFHHSWCTLYLLSEFGQQVVQSVTTDFEISCHPRRFNLG